MPVEHSRLPLPFLRVAGPCRSREAGSSRSHEGRARSLGAQRGPACRRASVSRARGLRDSGVRECARGRQRAPGVQGGFHSQVTSQVAVKDPTGAHRFQQEPQG